VWFLSFGASSPDMTAEMLAECGLKDAVREIYNMRLRESKYVLLNLERSGRTRVQQMKHVVEQLHAQFQMVSTQIVGYDSITGNAAADDGISLHPGFRFMVEAIRKGSDDVQLWVKDGQPEKKKGRGFLQRVLCDGDVESMSKKQLIAEVLKLKETNSRLESRLRDVGIPIHYIAGL
jgi:hypothetical protein